MNDHQTYLRQLAKKLQDPALAAAADEIDRLISQLHDARTAASYCWKLASDDSLEQSITRTAIKSAFAKVWPWLLYDQQSTE